MYVSDGSFHHLRAAAEERLARELEHRRSSAERAEALCAQLDELKSRGPRRFRRVVQFAVALVGVAVQRRVGD